MEEDDAITECHGSSRPCHKASIGEKGFDTEHADAVEKDSDVSACDGDGSAISEDGLDLFALLLDSGAFEGAPLVFKVLVDLLKALEVVLVEALDGGDGVFAFGEDKCGIALVTEEVLRGFDEFIESKAVEVLEIAELILSCAVGFKEFGVGVVDIFTTAVNAEVVDTAASAEDFSKFFVFFFAFLPSSGDECDIAVDVEFFEDLVDGGLEALGSKHDEMWHIVLASLCVVAWWSWGNERIGGSVGCAAQATNTDVEDARIHSVHR